MGKKSKGKGKDKAGKKDRKKALRPAAIELDVAVAPGPHDTLAPTISELEDDGGRRTVGTTELAARLASLAAVLQRRLARVDAGDGLTRARLSALALLVLGGPRTLGELASAEHVRPPTMTRLVHAMEAEGLVVRAPHPKDGRSVLMSATSRGVARLEDGRARQVAPLAESLAGLDRAQRLQLEDAADLLGRVFRDPTPEPSQPIE